MCSVHIFVKCKALKGQYQVMRTDKRFLKWSLLRPKSTAGRSWEKSQLKNLVSFSWRCLFKSSFLTIHPIVGEPLADLHDNDEEYLPGIPAQYTVNKTQQYTVHSLKILVISVFLLLSWRGLPLFSWFFPELFAFHIKYIKLYKKFQLETLLSIPAN